MIITVVVAATPIPVDGKASFGIETRRMVRGKVLPLLRVRRGGVKINKIKTEEEEETIVK